MKRKIFFAICLILCVAAFGLYSLQSATPVISEEWMDLPLSDRSQKTMCGSALSGTIGDTSTVAASSTTNASVQPVRIAQKECGNGVRITAWVQGDGMAYQVGDVIVIKVLITAPNTTTFNFDTVKSVLEFEGVQQFDTIRQVTVVSAPSVVPGRTAHLITFSLQSFGEMGKSLKFLLDLQYNDPALKRLQSPVLWISSINTVDASEQFIDLALLPVAENRPWSATVLFILALVFAMPLPALLLVQVAKRVRPDKLLSPEEKFWGAVDPVFLQAEKDQLDSFLASTILAQLKILWDLTAATASEVISAKQISLDAQLLGYVVNTCDRVSTNPSATVTKEELGKLKSALELLVVRPLNL